jgi:U3 small nucleolar RNA-associated protein 24
MAELEKLGLKYRIALRIARDEVGTLAVWSTYIRMIAWWIGLRSIRFIFWLRDRDLKRRVRKVPGVPIMSVARGKYVIERLPGAPEK